MTIKSPKPSINTNNTKTKLNPVCLSAMNKSYYSCILSPAYLPNHLTKYPHNHSPVPSIHHAAQSFCIIAWWMSASVWLSAYLSIFSSSFHLPVHLSACLRTCFCQRKQKFSVRTCFQSESRLCAFLIQLQIKCWTTAFFSIIFPLLWSISSYFIAAACFSNFTCAVIIMPVLIKLGTENNIHG